MKKISFFICVMLFSILQAQITTVEEDISIDQMLSTIGLSVVTSNMHWLYNYSAKRVNKNIDVEAIS